MRRGFIDMLRDSLRQGPRGMLLDLQLESRECRVEPPKEPIPIHLWHGEADTDSPPVIARYFASRLPGARLHRYPAEGHVSIFVRRAGEILKELAPRSHGGGLV